MNAVGGGNHRTESTSWGTMPLVTTGELVAEAQRRGAGIAAFNVITLEHAEAIAAGAEAAGRPAVLAPYRWMRSADVLPHSWDATSDSVAAFIAGALDAAHLVLVKPRDGPPEEMVDGCFFLVLPADLPWTVIGWERLNELPGRLRRR